MAMCCATTELRPLRLDLVCSWSRFEMTLRMFRGHLLLTQLGTLPRFVLDFPRCVLRLP